MDKKIKLAIIGCGWITENGHVPGLLKLGEDLECTLLADPSRKRRDRIGDMLKVPPAARYEDLADAQLTDIDLALVATPHLSHYGIAETLIRRGISIILEKPPASTPEQLKKLVQLSIEYDTDIFVVHNYTYRPIFAAALEAVSRGDIGDIFMFRAHVYDHAHFPGVEEFDPDWRTKDSLAGAGCFADNGYHYLYLATALTGSPVGKVTAHMATARPGVDVEELALATLVHENGALTSIHCSWCVLGGGSHAIEIYGTKGTIKIDEDKDEMSIFQESEGTWKTIAVSGGDHHFEGFYRDVLREYMRAPGQRRGRLFPGDAADVTELLEKIYETAKSASVGDK